MKTIFLVILCSLPSLIKAQDITTIAGNGTQGYTGDGAAAASAELYHPLGVVMDKLGNLYIADTYNYRIRKVSTTGTITTIAGNGINGYGGDGGPAIAAAIYPSDVAVDTFSNVYFADAQDNVIRKISTSGIITTVAGNGDGAGTFNSGFSGDGGPADSAELSDPNHVAVDAAGNIYIVDQDNNRIRKVNTAGIISTICGNSGQGYTGDGGPAALAELYNPEGVSVDGQGDVYISDFSNARIRKIDTAGVITTIAGNGTAGYSGDGGPALTAKISPTGNPIFRNGSLYFADGSNTIRRVDSLGNIHTFAGNGVAGFSGDGGTAAGAELHTPAGITFDGKGNMYIADAGNNVIREVFYDTNLSVQQLNVIVIGISPNPAIDLLHISIETTANYRLLNMVGVVVQQGTLQQGANNVPVKMLAPGMYLFEANNGQQNVVRKIVKQ